MFVRTGYQLNLVQYRPLDVREGASSKRWNRFGPLKKLRRWWIVDDVVTRVVR